MEVFVKKLLIILCIGVLIAGTVSAQAIREQQREAAPQARNNRQENLNNQNNQNNNNQRANNIITVNGTLKLERGLVAIESGDNVYYVPMLTRYIGFINGLREGASISVEGSRFRNSIQPAKVTLEGRTYNFNNTYSYGPAPAFNNQNQNRRHENVRQHHGHNNRHGYSGNRNAPNRGGCGCNCGNSNRR